MPIIKFSCIIRLSWLECSVLPIAALILTFVIQKCIPITCVLHCIKIVNICLTSWFRNFCIHEDLQIYRGPDFYQISLTSEFSFVSGNSSWSDSSGPSQSRISRFRGAWRRKLYSDTNVCFCTASSLILSFSLYLCLSPPLSLSLSLSLYLSLSLSVSVSLFHSLCLPLSLS